MTGVSVQAHDWDTIDFMGEDHTDSEGRYNLTGLPLVNSENGSGSYRVMAFSAGYRLQYWNGAPVRGLADNVTLTESNPTMSGINFHLTPCNFIRGHVWQDDGETPIPGIQVSVYENITLSGKWRWLASSATTDNGSYKVTAAMGPASYLVLARGTGYTAEYYQNAATQDTADPVVVTAGQDKLGVDFTLTPTGQVSVTTDPATGVATTSATLNGYLGSLGTAASVTVSFEYGLNKTYGSPAAGTPPSLSAPGGFTANLTGLTAGTTYHFRAIAEGDGGPVYGDDASFTTSTTEPTVTTNAAGNLATTSATLNGYLGSLGTASSATVSFEYGLNKTYGSPAAGTPPSLSAPGGFSANLTGLTAGTTYHFRAIAEGDGGPVYGNDVSFTTTIPPTVTTNAAGNTATTSATLNGYLGSPGTASSVTVSFEYGLNKTYGSPAAGTPPSLSAPGGFSANLTGLTAGTTYHFRAIAEGDGGPVYGDDVSFTTTIPPTVTTNAAGNVATTSATLNGNLGNLGTAQSVVVCFEWGTTSGGPYAYVTEGQPMTGTGAFTANLAGFTAGITYYCRAMAAGHGTALGDEVCFTTLTMLPTVTTTAASSLATTSATLNGCLGSLGTEPDVSVSFEWGTTTGYGSETSAQSISANGAFSTELTGLAANTIYHYRAKAVGHGATVYGADMIFTTADAETPEAPAESGGVPVWAWALIAIAAVGAMGAVAFLVMRGRMAQR